MSTSNSKRPVLPVTNKKSEPSQVSVFLIIIIAAAGGGFLTVNFLKMITVSHIHVSQGHALHKEAAFNAFVGNKSIGKGQASNTGSTSAAVGTSTDTQQLPYDVKEATQKLSTRVCGSPAIDGYAHVNHQCLESSPTSQWWLENIVATNRWDLLVAHVEKEADYDGLAVYWGIGNTKKTFEECAQHCMDHRPGEIPGPFENLPCNAFAWCGEKVCFEPDAHQHHRGDCWLKFTEGPVSPEVNMRGKLPDEFRARHAGNDGAPERVQWVAGVLLPRGVTLTNGTMGPRWWW